MSRYIDLDKLLFGRTENLDGTIYPKITAYDIVKIPIADVRENVHGEWVSTKTNVYPTCYTTQCSVCNFSVFYSCNDNLNNHYNFCPNCGADMRKDVEE